jgi:uncharacterized protein YkwD
VRNIEVRALAGDDVVDLRGLGTRPGPAPAVAVWGGAGDDLIWGSRFADRLFGGAGNDVIHGRQGDDHLDGGPGNDRLFGDMWNDRLLGGPGNDLLWGGSGNDYLDGGSGRDQLNGNSGNDVLLWRGGGDRLSGGSGQDRAYLGATGRPAALPGIEQVLGQPSTATSVSSFAADTRRLIELINAYRAEEGLSRLRSNSSLTAAAQGHASYMARTGNYSHFGPKGQTLGDRARAAGYAFHFVGENIHQYDPASGRTMGVDRHYSLSELPEFFLDGWKASPSHDENLLYPDVEDIGVAFARSSSGMIYAVLMIGSR